MMTVFVHGRIIDDRFSYILLRPDQISLASCPGFDDSGPCNITLILSCMMYISVLSMSVLFHYSLTERYIPLREGIRSGPTLMITLTD